MQPTSYPFSDEQRQRMKRARDAVEKEFTHRMVTIEANHAEVRRRLGLPKETPK